MRIVCSRPYCCNGVETPCLRRCSDEATGELGYESQDDRNLSVQYRVTDRRRNPLSLLSCDNRAKAANSMTATFGLMYFITCCLIAVGTCYVALRLYLVQWSAVLHHTWQQNLFHVHTAWFFNFHPNVIL